MRGDDFSNDLILRYGDELEECLKVYRGPVFAEDERRGGAGDAHLTGVDWILAEPFYGENGGQIAVMNRVDLLWIIPFSCGLTLLPNLTG